MFTLPIPSSLATEQLRAELADAGIETLVYVRGDELVLANVDTPEDGAAASAVVDAHEADPDFGLTEDDVKRRELVAKPSETWTQADRDEALRLALAKGLT